MLGIGGWKQRMVDPAHALPGRDTPMAVRNAHHVHGRPIAGEFTGLQTVQFGMGCFWGAERKFWRIPACLHHGGRLCRWCHAQPDLPRSLFRRNRPCRSGAGGVRPRRSRFDGLLKTFWESHDPTQGMRQGNDIGTQYRSAIYCSTQAQFDAAIASRDAYQRRLLDAGLGGITTEIVYPAPAFFYAEDEHQQYLSKNPMGYCGLGGTGVSCPIGTGA
jgi:peptide-methionine (S)-S-oxide reductase